MSFGKLAFSLCKLCMVSTILNLGPSTPNHDIADISCIPDVNL